MLTVNISELIWAIICFFALYFLLRRFLFDPIIKHMDAREAKIAAGETEQAAVNAELSRRRDEAEKLCAEAKRENEKLAAAEAEFLSAAKNEAVNASRSELKAARAEAYKAAGEAVKSREELVSSESEKLSGALLDRLVSGAD